MSTLYKSRDEVPTEALCSRLDELSTAVTQGREAVGRAFGMRVPAELDYDADLVLAEASKRLRELAASRELCRQYREVAELMRDSQILKGNNPAAKMAMWFDALAKLEALNQSVKTDAEI